MRTVIDTNQIQQIIEQLSNPAFSKDSAVEALNALLQNAMRKHFPPNQLLEQINTLKQQEHALKTIPLNNISTHQAAKMIRDLSQIQGQINAFEQVLNGKIVI